MKLVFNPLTGKFDLIDKKDIHSGVNIVDAEKTIYIEAKKEMRVKYLENKGVVKNYGLIVVD